MQIMMSFGTTCELYPGPAAPFLCPRFRDRSSVHVMTGSHLMPWWKSWNKKYVILCCVCGGTAILLGVVFIAIYFTLHYYTSSLEYFETIPTYAPAVVLIITGLLVVSFARRRNRYPYLIKLCGGCCLMCALLCVVITVTTTVIHMNRLQTLRECVYTHKSNTCTCFAGVDSEGVTRYTFNNTPDCEVVHGGLYTCLRAMFGLSVIGILTCIFSSMLVYQLLSHEKKKVYWEQLEMRRRYFYCQRSHLLCNCCDDYGFAAAGGLQPREGGSDRCWPSRAFTPRLGFAADENVSHRSVLLGSTVGHRPSGWNWIPWSRSTRQDQPERSTRNPSSNAVDNNFLSTQALGFETNADNLSRGDVYRRGDHYAAVTVDRRRWRSNDAIYHRFNLISDIYFHSPFAAQSSFSHSGTTYASLRHIWGPPPPYTQQAAPADIDGLASGVGDTSDQRMHLMTETRVVAAAGHQLGNAAHLVPQGAVQRKPSSLPVDRVVEDATDGQNIASISTEHWPAADVVSHKRIGQYPTKLLDNYFTLPYRKSRRLIDRFLSCSKSTPHIPQCSSKLHECNDLRTAAVSGNNKAWISEPICNSLLQSAFVDTVTSTSDCSTSSTNSYIDDCTETEVPSDFRTSMIVSTTPSSPANNVNVCHVGFAFARSLPNISVDLLANQRY